MIMTNEKFDMINDIKLYLESETDLNRLQYMGFKSNFAQFEYVDEVGRYATFYVNIYDFMDTLKYYDTLAYISYDSNDKTYYVSLITFEHDINGSYEIIEEHGHAYKYEKTALSYAKKLVEQHNDRFAYIEVANA